MRPWKEVFKEYNQRLLFAAKLMLKSLKGLSFAFGATWLFLCFLSQDTTTGEWYVAARINDLIANLGGGFLGELGAVCILFLMIGMGVLVDEVFNTRIK